MCVYVCMREREKEKKKQVYSHTFMCQNPHSVTWPIEGALLSPSTVLPRSARNGNSPSNTCREESKPPLWCCRRLRLWGPDRRINRTFHSRQGRMEDGSMGCGGVTEGGTFADLAQGERSQGREVYLIRRCLISSRELCVTWAPF